MAVVIPSQEQITVDMLAEITDSLDKREGSLIRTSISPIAWYINKVYNELSEIEKQGFLSTATGEYLEKITINRGINRQPATYSVRRGVFNMELPIGTQFIALNGNDNLKYTITEFIEQKDNEYNYKMVCDTLGIIGNQYTGSLQGVSYIAGLTKAELTSIITAGEDEETDESLRQRYIDTLNQKSFGGNIASYKDYFNTRQGVGAIEIYPFWKGGGTTLISILNSSYEIPDDSFIEELQIEICPPEADDASPSANGYGLAPIGAIVTITKPEKFNVNIECTIIKNNVDDITVKNKIEKVLNSYLLSLRKSFETKNNQYSNEYVIKILYAKIYSDIFSIDEVLNIISLKINGESNKDITITNTAEQQQVPFLGDLTINYE